MGHYRIPQNRIDRHRHIRGEISMPLYAPDPVVKFLRCRHLELGQHKEDPAGGPQPETGPAPLLETSVERDSASLRAAVGNPQGSELCGNKFFQPFCGCDKKFHVHSLVTVMAFVTGRAASHCNASASALSVICSDASQIYRSKSCDFITSDGPRSFSFDAAHPVTNSLRNNQLLSKPYPVIASTSS